MAVHVLVNMLFLFVVDKFVEEMTSYIEGNVDIIPQNDNPLPTEMADIYYLIADHYFKNKTWVIRI